MPLSDTAVRAAKPQEKPYKLADGGGLFLLVNPKGAKWWRIKYRFDGKEKLLSFGTYPDVTLKAAREKREEARKLLAAGIDPGAKRKADKAAGEAEQANTFEAIAREWHATQKSRWTDRHAGRVLDRLVKDLFPFLGHRPVNAITAAELLAALRKKEGKGAAYSAKRLRQISDQVFRFAIATGRAERNPAPDL
ncbi:MAG: tyrosine-type recombinase/integrase, partial [Pseudomonadota bacterium]